MALHQLIPTPAAGFDQPLGVLSGCHSRILHFCTLLERLTVHLQTYGIDRQAVETAHLIHRYFSTAGKHHHRDEEDDLQAMLAELASVDTAQFAATAEQFISMNREHVGLENRELLPRAATLLSNKQQEQLGRAMARRRNVEYVSPTNGDMA
jgi:hemerythrin-like domain-containing protein